MMLTLTWWTIILTCHYLIKGLKSDGRTSTRFDVSQPINLRPSDWIFYPQSTFSSVWILSSVLINTQIDQLEHINIWQGRPKTYFTYKWWPGTHIYINVTHWRNDRDLICITLTGLHWNYWVKLYSSVSTSISKRRFNIFVRLCDGSSIILIIINLMTINNSG